VSDLSSIIPGGTTAAHVRANMAVAGMPALPAEVVRYLEDRYRNVSDEMNYLD